MSIAVHVALAYGIISILSGVVLLFYGLELMLILPAIIGTIDVIGGTVLSAASIAGLIQ